MLIMRIRVLAGDQVFINVGTHAVIPSLPGLGAAGPLTNIELLELDYVPQHLIVLGGGYVGLELAQAYRRFGSRVTVIEHGPRLADREVADEMRRILSDEGIDILLGAETRNVQGHSGDVSLRVAPACHTPSCATRSSHTRPWRKDLGPFSRMCRRGSPERHYARFVVGACQFAIVNVGIGVIQGTERVH